MLVKRRCPGQVPASRSSFTGLRFPPNVIMIAVRWYLCPPGTYSADLEFTLLDCHLVAGKRAHSLTRCLNVGQRLALGGFLNAVRNLVSSCPQ